MTIETHTESTNSAEEEATTINLDEFNKLKANYHDAVAERDKTKIKLRSLEQVINEHAVVKQNYEALINDNATLKTNYDKLQTEVNLQKETEKNKFIETSLTAALEAAGSISIPTALKLIDKGKVTFEGDNLLNDSVINLINELKASDPILFGTTDPKLLDGKQTGPGATSLGIPVKHAGDNDISGAFEKELRQTKNNEEIQNVLRKYGKIQ
jgi:hypothetical protein